MKKIAYSVVTAMLIFSPVSADNLIYDDLIVTGSECLGFDCVDGEAFGFDTLRLKENNLRIKFEDTSASPFPGNDWQITINDTSSGGLNHFSIEDITGATKPFTIEAGADANSFYMDDYGRIGLGTSLPAVELHIADGDTPTVRLDQDGSSGWSPQIWDVAGNETNFFIRDVTNGSKLPFRIQPDAPSSSLTIKSTGYVGIGTWAPENKLHVDYAAASTSDLQELFKLSSNNTDISHKSDPGFVIQNKKENFSWTFRTWEPNSGFVISKQYSGAKEMTLTGVDSIGGMELLLGNGAKNSGGQWLDASSRSLKENIHELDIQTAMEAFNKLKPVTYNYKTNKNENVVGFIAEDVPEVVATNDRKTLSALEMVALLTKVVQEQGKTVSEQQKMLQEQAKKIEHLEESMEMMPSTEY